jgi:2',3'-cyclic-nucleotide 2'-phosphodiesterase (5'-nucleotidase family)
VVDDPEPEELPDETLEPPLPTIANLKFPLTPGTGEHALGRLVADAYRNGVRSHFAIVSNESITAGLPAGPVNRDDLLAVLSADHSLVRFTLTGEELRAVLEHVVATDNPIAHISGMEVWYDPRRGEGSRIRSVRLPDGRDVRSNQSYTLAAGASLFVGTGGFSTVRWLPREDVALSNVEALENYLRLLRQPVEAPSEDRFHTSR